MSAHVREWEVRRLMAGELDAGAEQQLRAHLAACAECRDIESALLAERQQFESALPFDEFANGVERKLQPRTRAARRSAGRWVQGIAALAACALVAVIAPRLIGQSSGVTRSMGHNRLKGGAEVELRIAGANQGPQRIASDEGDEALGPGERVRIGFRPGTHHFVAAVSVDAQGNVSALYPESGTSLRAEPSPQVTYLPGSLEFTGHGRERVIVVLSDQPLQVDALESAARMAWSSAGGDVSKLPPLGVPGEQFQRTLLKP